VFEVFKPSRLHKSWLQNITATAQNIRLLFIVIYLVASSAFLLEINANIKALTKISICFPEYEEFFSL